MDEKGLVVDSSIKFHPRARGKTNIVWTPNRPKRLDTSDSEMNVLEVISPALPKSKSNGVLGVNRQSDQEASQSRMPPCSVLPPIHPYHIMMPEHSWLSCVLCVCRSVNCSVCIVVCVRFIVDLRRIVTSINYYPNYIYIYILTSD